MPKNPASKKTRSLTIKSRNVEDLRNLLKPRSDFSLHLFKDVVFEACMVRQSLFTGAIFRNCKFHRSDFSRCDFEGARLENCVFDDVDLSSIDLRSTLMSGCSFSESRFDGAYISDCSLSTTQFSSCSLAQITMVDNRTKSVRIFKCNLEASTILQNTFSSTSFEDQTLGNCTILYSIFEDCHFRSVRINADAIGWSFGIKRDQLANIEFIFLGKPTVKPATDQVISGLVETYEQKGWEAQAAVTRMNFGMEHPLSAFRTIIASILAIARGLPVKKDDITFIIRVMKMLRHRAQLPFFSVVSAFEKAQERLRTSLSGEPAVEYLSQELYILLDQMRGELFATVQPLTMYSVHEKVAAELVYDEQPPASGVFSLTAASQLTGLSRSSARLEAARSGSYIEVITTTIYSLFALWVALYLIEGCIVRLTFVRVRIGKLVAKRPPVAYERKALEPQQQLPEEFEKPLRKMLEALSSSNIEAVLRVPGIANNGLKEMRIKKPKRQR